MFGGPISDPGTEFYANYMPTPVRHGMTFGELARFYNANAKLVDLDPALLDARATTIGTPAPDDKPRATQPGLHAQLTVIQMQNWHRRDYYEDTGVPWLPSQPQPPYPPRRHPLPRRRTHRNHQHQRRPRHPDPLRADRRSLDQRQRTNRLPDRPPDPRHHHHPHLPHHRRNSRALP